MQAGEEVSGGRKEWVSNLVKINKVSKRDNKEKKVKERVWKLTVGNLRVLDGNNEELLLKFDPAKVHMLLKTVKKGEGKC